MLIIDRIPRIVDYMTNAFLEHGWPSLKYWMEATQSTALAAQVIWWQTSITREAATTLPTGNAPTAIQLARHTPQKQPLYPCILDWVPHPGMRENLILNHESYDIDQVVCDMTNAFVVEVEDNTPVFDDTGVPIPVVGKGCGYNLMELVQWTSIFGPLDNHSHEALTVMGMLRNMTASQRASINSIHRFKIDPRFFQKYPSLYDPEAVSRYWPKEPPHVHMSELPPPFTAESAKSYETAALHAQQAIAAG